MKVGERVKVLKGAIAEGFVVGANDGFTLGLSLGVGLGLVDGGLLGNLLGVKLGVLLGITVGTVDGILVGVIEGILDGSLLGIIDGITEGFIVKMLMPKANGVTVGEFGMTNGGLLFTGTIVEEIGVFVGANVGEATLRTLVPQLGVPYDTQVF